MNAFSASSRSRSTQTSGARLPVLTMLILLLPMLQVLSAARLASAEDLVPPLDVIADSTTAIQEPVINPPDAPPPAEETATEPVTDTATDVSTGSDTVEIAPPPQVIEEVSTDTATGTDPPPAPPIADVTTDPAIETVTEVDTTTALPPIETTTDTASDPEQDVAPAQRRSAPADASLTSKTLPESDESTSTETMASLSLVVDPPVTVGSILVKLTDQHGTPLTGADFEFDSGLPLESPVPFSITDPSGERVIFGLSLSTFPIYTVTPLTAPAGCSIAGSQSAQLSADVITAYMHFVSTCGDVVPAADGTITVTLTDHLGAPLSGINFEITAALPGSPPPETRTTDATGSFALEDVPFALQLNIHQVAAPAGCSVPGDQRVTVTSTAPNAYLRFVSICAAAPPTGTISVQTRDQLDAPLAGIQYQLLDGTTVVDSWTSDTSVRVIRDLPLDTLFTVHQVAVPEGCSLEPDQTLTLTAVSPAQGMAFIHDCAAPVTTGEITVTKVDQFLTPKAGGEFQVLDGVTVVGTGTSGADGTVTITGLTLDVPYTLHETLAPAGCIAGPDTAFTLTTAEPSQSLTVTNECTAAPPSTEISIIKTNQDGFRLPGAVFQLLDGTTVLATGTTNAIGVLEFDGYPLDVAYTVHELTPPEGCVAGDNVTFTLTAAEPLAIRTVVNQCTEGTGSVTITKVDHEDNPLLGITFEVQEADGTVVASGGTSIDGRLTLTGLDLDVPYTLHEVEARTGCMPAADEHVTLTADAPHHDLTIVNDCTGAPGAIVVYKIDQHGHILAGVPFEILDGERSVATGTTAADGTVEFPDLPFGVTYTVRETAAPEGCTGAEDSTAKVTEENRRVVVTVVNECDDIVGTLTIVKTDQDGNPLGNVRFLILDGETVIASGVTGLDGRLYGDRYGIDVEYTIREEAAPEGCVVAEDQRVTLTEEALNQTVTVVNVCETDEPAPVTPPGEPGKPGLAPPTTGGTTAPTQPSAAVTSLPNTGSGAAAATTWGWMTLAVIAATMGLAGLGLRRFHTQP